VKILPVAIAFAWTNVQYWNPL